MQANDIHRRITEKLTDAQVEVKDLTGTGDHFEARVVSGGFNGKTPVERHQLVYAAVSDWLRSGELHALTLKTYAPEEWAAAKPKL
jgi:acid stress-induced BolA-like protein IbaG/YrbA